MKHIVIRNGCNIAFLIMIIQFMGCVENIREASSDTIAASIKQVPRSDKQHLAWFAPELQVSNYRTLFYGYDTVEYRLAGSGDTKNRMNHVFRLLIEAQYGGNVRHYAFAKLSDKSTLEINHYQHDTEECKIYNSLISSCLYRDRFNLNLSRSDLENASNTGLQLFLTSGEQNYEQIDLPPNYIQGVLKAIEVLESKQVH